MRWTLTLLVLLAGCDEDGAARRRERAASLGASYPEGTAGVGVLVDMLDDDDASVREEAARSLAALGRRGLAALSAFLADRDDPARDVLLAMGRRFAALGAALTPGDLAEPMAAGQSADTRRAAAASAVLAAWGEIGSDTLIDILTAVRRDADPRVGATASASLALLGWAAVRKQHPASCDDVKDLVPLVVPLGEETEWPSWVAACLIAVLRPRTEWPEHLDSYPYGAAEMPVPAAGAADRLRGNLESLVESAPGDPDDWERRGRLMMTLHALRAMGTEAGPLGGELARLLARERGMARVAVARALFAVAPAESAPAARALAEVLHGSDPQVCREALNALVVMGPDARPAVPAVLEVLAWPEEDGAEDPAGQCAKLGAKWQHALHAKRDAASILGHAGAKADRRFDVVPALDALARHEDARLRYRAATALRRIGQDSRPPSPVDAGLAWLAGEQKGEEGGWPSNDYKVGPVDPATTGLVLLAFVGAGFEPLRDDHAWAPNMRRAIRALLDLQGGDGVITAPGPLLRRPYHHALATLALAEVLRQSEPDGLRGRAQRAVDALVAQRAPGAGWNYPRTESGGRSLTTWSLMALHSARLAGLTVDAEAEASARAWLLRQPFEEPPAGKTGWHGETPAGRAAGIVLAYAWGGGDLDDAPEGVRKARAYLEAHPLAPDSDMHDWFLGTIAMFQCAGESWRGWWPHVRKRVVKTQEREDARLAGSWSGAGGHAAHAGRVHSTALMTLTLEVAYRYDRMIGLHPVAADAPRR